LTILLNFASNRKYLNNAALGCQGSKNEKKIYTVLGLAVLFGVLFALGGAKEAVAQVPVTIGIVPPPPLQFATPPDLYVVPSGPSYVYMVPNYDGVYFYGGYWYRFYNGYWFQSPFYNGYWNYIEPSMVPQVIFLVPPEYIHYVPYDYYRIPYNDFYGNWRTWDNSRHWHRYDWYQHEMRDDIRRERYSHIERDRQQRGVQTQHHHEVQRHQQYDVQKPEHHNVQQPQPYNVQKPKQHEAQKPKHQQGEKQSEAPVR